MKVKLGFHIWEKERLQGFDSSVPREIFGPEWEEGTVWCRDA